MIENDNAPRLPEKLDPHYLIPTTELLSAQKELENWAASEKLDPDIQKTIIEKLRLFAEQGASYLDLGPDAEPGSINNNRDLIETLGDAELTKRFNRNSGYE